jgi:hypothetical protein
MGDLKREELKKQKDRERQQEWDDVLYHEMGSIVEIDDSIKLDKHTYLTSEQKFTYKMSLKHITFEGEYLNGKSVVSLECGVCGHAWDEAGVRVLRRGCPACFAIDNNIHKARNIWIRSKQIIADKGGKIVKLPPQTLEHIVSLDDKFGLMCGDGGHIFTFTHKKLRDNQWCPSCAQLGLNRPIRTSENVYRRNVTDQMRYDKLFQIAQLKQMSMDSRKWTDRMKFTCAKCGEMTVLSARQLCENKFPCRNRCTATHKMKM